MPVEIRELIIKTEVRSELQKRALDEDHEDLSELKHEIMMACKRMIQENTRRANFKR